MLTQIQLHQFKCFEVLRLPLSPLTLLSGANATGKSSVLQALLLLHQTLRYSQSSTNITLNGYAVQLGTVGDVVNQTSGRRTIAIELQSNEFECKWEMETDDRRMLSFPIHRIFWRASPVWSAEDSIINSGVILDNLLPREISKLPQAQTIMNSLIQLSYISADRSAPREAYPVAIDSPYPTVGVKGEYTPWYLVTFDQKEIIPKMQHPGEPAPYLRRQVDAWMDHFFPGAGLSVTQISDTNLVKLLLRTNTGTDFLRPQNVGYGLTHILPIITACLGANRGDLIIVENPESHLHPAAQSAMGEFLAIAASAGIQIILETHSDHVLNGLRKAVRNETITQDDVLIHFFTKQPNGATSSSAQVTSPQIDRNGNFDYWPDDFFDQSDKDLNSLIDWGI